MGEIMSVSERIAQFLSAEGFAVAGASTNRDKYGNKVLRCYMQQGKRVIPINPHASAVEGLASVASISDLPDDVQSLSIITPPAITEQVVEAAIAKGIRNVWMQPGAQSAKAMARCEEAGINLIADGSCLLVVLGYHDA
jgi:predicted CoA-binding protein